MVDIPRCCKGCLWVDDCRTNDSYEWEELRFNNPEMISCFRNFTYVDTDGKTPRENAIEVMLLITEIKRLLSERDLAIERYYKRNNPKTSFDTPEVVKLYGECWDKVYKIRDKIKDEFGISMGMYRGDRDTIHIDSLEYILKQLFWRR